MARIGLVLGAGGSVGQAYHLGVLSGIAEATGWDARTAEVVVGTSAGSLVGAYLRAGLAATDLAAAMLRETPSPAGRALLDRMGRTAASPPASRAPGLPRPASPKLLTRAVRRPGSIRIGALASALLPAGNGDNAAVVGRLRRVYDGNWSTDPLLICAVRLDDGVLVPFGAPGTPRTDVPTAVAASCAIPGYWKPVVVGDQRYVDGGVHSPTNADLLANPAYAGALDLVVVSSPMSFARGAGRLPSMLVRVPPRRYLAREVAALRRGGTAVVVVQPTAADLAVMGTNAMDGRRAPDVLRQARDSTIERLAAGGSATRALRLLNP